MYYPGILVSGTVYICGLKNFSVILATWSSINANTYFGPQNESWRWLVKMRVWPSRWGPLGMSKPPITPSPPPMHTNHNHSKHVDIQTQIIVCGWSFGWWYFHLINHHYSRTPEQLTKIVTGNLIRWKVNVCTVQAYLNCLLWSGPQSQFSNEC